MTENTKTLTFAGTALAVLLLALFVSRPQVAGDSVPADLNQKFFPKFDDPLAAKSLEIIDYDEETGQRSVFEVAQDAKGVWSIPSHGGYPADAEKQLAEAAASIIDLKKGNLESNDPKMQESYGVVAPPDTSAAAKGPATSKGVGKEVTFKDKDGNLLAQLIIGKQVKDAPVSRDREGPPPPPLRYVRVPGSDAIYSTPVKTTKLSTRFDDWIEKDLLKMKLGVHNVKQMYLNDYTVNIEQGAIDMRGFSTLAFDSKNSTWAPVEFKMVDKLSGQLIARQLKDDEEIDNQKLNDLKNALNDLRIADVQRKPAGLSANLQAGEELMQGQQALISLAQRGFYRAKINNRPEIVSKEGEVRCRMDDGVEYVLRFGNIAGRGKAEDLEDDKPKDEKADDKAAGDNKLEEAKKPADDDNGKKDDAEKTADARRFLFVAVEFNPDMIPKPELEALPAEEGKPAGPDPDAKSDEKKAEAKPEAKKDDKSGDDKKPDDKKTEEGDEEKKPANPERERIEKENQRKQDEYDKQVKKGEERVAELNRRFADWYYVIPDKTYQKIHLTQADIIKKKAPPADKATPVPDLLPQKIEDPFLPKIPGEETPAQLPEKATPPAAKKGTPAAPKTTPQPPTKNDKDETPPKKPEADKTDEKK